MVWIRGSIVSLHVGNCAELSHIVKSIRRRRPIHSWGGRGHLRVHSPHLGGTGGSRSVISAPDRIIRIVGSIGWCFLYSVGRKPV